MMPKLSICEESPGFFTVEGNLTYACINKKTAKLVDSLKSSEQINIDFSKVDAVDSAGLALMIEWIKLCRINQVQLRFNNIPDQLLALAKLSGFDTNEYFAKHADSASLFH